MCQLCVDALEKYWPELHQEDWATFWADWKPKYDRHFDPVAQLVAHR